jgi:serine/threonine protein kinase
VEGVFLMIGKTLGHYEITSQLGKGGMGEVYQAKDLKLGRDVAIKVLPEAFAKDADRVARFQREATLLASLNHPNIAAIYGLEESGGTDFLVLELVEGQTLADQLKRGPTPVEESLKLALQIAEALEAAHEKGIIHRDLKPGNIKVTPDGKVKVLDFGLAKAFAGEQADLNLSNSPTLSNAATQQGVILGTAAYMSPEQARGKTVDKRTDIWAFGCVLYEMLTGRAAFSGNDVSDILAAVIRAEPEWNNLPANLHWRLREVLERCLKKNAKDRYHDISDVKADIQRVLADPSGVLVQPVAVAEPRSRMRTILPWIAAVVILSAITGAIVWNLIKPEPRQVSRFSYELPKDQQFGNLMQRAIAVSPDGRQFVYSTEAGFYLRSMDETNASLLPGTGGNQQWPFFSPDGKWIGFFSSADNKLKKIATSGGMPVAIAEVEGLTGSGNWNADGTILYTPAGKGIMRVSANGGSPEQIIKQPEDDRSIVDPQILPDGKSVLFTSFSRGAMDAKIMVQSLKSGELEELFEGGSAKYLPTGHIVYESENSLFTVRFDVNAHKVIGGPVSVVEGVLWGTDSQYAVSDSGTLLYISGATFGTLEEMLGLPRSPNPRTLVWVDRKGKEKPLAAQSNKYRSPTISPDGTRVAMTIGYIGEKADIWIWDTVRETMTRLTFNEGSEFPLWSLDGQRVAFWSFGNSAVYWKAADGSGEDEKLASALNRALIPLSWSSDGKTLVTKEGTPNTSSNIGSISMEGDHKLGVLLQEKYDEDQPEISPDGRWMAYTSNESGRGEIYVRPFPDVNKGRWQISTAGGDSPLWSRNGREIFYRSGDVVMAVAVGADPTFKTGKPETLFRGMYISWSALEGHTWDISLDGKSFLMMKEVASTNKQAAAEGPRKINIVLNWFEELKQRVPVK